MIDAKTLAAHFAATYGAEPTHAFQCPGRVNLIGEHIDYNGGYVFPAAISMGITAVVRLRDDNVVRLYSRNMDSGTEIALSPGLKYDPAIGWANYAKGVLAYLIGKGHELKGMDVLLEGDLPDGSGLSSSAALEVLMAYLCLRLTGKADNEIDRSWLAQACQAVENHFVGVNCGIMDQFSVANGRAGHAMLLDCQSLDFEQVPVELGANTLLIVNSNKERQLAESKYNERRAECEKALELINRRHGYPDLCSAQMEDVEELVHDPVLKRRAKHVVSEQARTLKAVEVLKAGDMVAFGQLLTASHKSLSEDYEVSGPELDALVDAALAQPGCLGARMTGAGFGGCAIVLVATDKAEALKQAVKERYNTATGRDCVFYASIPSEGVHEVALR